MVGAPTSNYSIISSVRATKTTSVQCTWAWSVAFFPS